jgi:hypothetical protein
MTMKYKNLQHLGSGEKKSLRIGKGRREGEMQSPTAPPFYVQ